MAMFICAICTETKGASQKGQMLCQKGNGVLYETRYVCTRCARENNLILVTEKTIVDFLPDGDYPVPRSR